MELNKVKTQIEKLSKSKGISIQAAWDIFFFDEFINRLSKSKYANDFIFKGGFYLQNVLGVEKRSTLDIDFKYSGNNITEEILSKMMIII